MLYTFRKVEKGDEVIYRDLNDEMVFVSNLTESGMKIDPKDQTETHILPSKRNPASLKTKFVKQYNPFSKELDVSAVHIQASDRRLRFYNK